MNWSNTPQLFASGGSSVPPLQALPEEAPLSDDFGRPLQPLLIQLRRRGRRRAVLCNCCYPTDSGQYQAAALCPERLLLGMSAAAARLGLEVELHMLEPALCLADPGALFQRAAGGPPMVPASPAQDFLGRPAVCASPQVWCRVYGAVSGHSEWSKHACLSVHGPQQSHKQCYKYIFVNTVLIPFIVVILYVLLIKLFPAIASWPI